MSRTHGNYGSYSGGCRCTACTDANAEYHRKARLRRGSRIDPEDPRHGTESFYADHSCRCDPCRFAHNRRERERYARRKAQAGA